MDNDKITRLLERLGRTLSAGDLRGVSSCFEFPAVFLSDDGATVLADASQLEKLFAQAIGLVSVAWARLDKTSAKFRSTLRSNSSASSAVPTTAPKQAIDISEE
jgi:hypothetical protein